MIIIIDNYDSFTYNLYQQVENLGFKTKIFKHDEITVKTAEKMNPKKIIISPGPKGPKDAGISNEIIQCFYKKIPILGVCLGHQCIGEVFGSNIVNATHVMHGKRSQIFHSQKNIFRNIKNPFFAARYHSLIVDRVPPNFILNAWTEGKTIMSIRHVKYPLIGIQFHPESFLTPDGNKIMYNFLYEI